MSTVEKGGMIVLQLQVERLNQGEHMQAGDRKDPSRE
jgi:hypothetical protein